MPYFKTLFLSTLSAYPTKYTKSPGLKHYDCFRVPDVLQYGNSNHPMIICSAFYLLGSNKSCCWSQGTLSARVCKQQLPNRTLSPSLVQSVLSTSEMLIPGCLHITWCHMRITILLLLQGRQVTGHELVNTLVQAPELLLGTDTR